MRQGQTRLCFSAALTTLMALAGCGDGAPSVSSSNTEATVHGVISIDGKPMTGEKSASIPRTSTEDLWVPTW